MKVNSFSGRLCLLMGNCCGHDFYGQDNWDIDEVQALGGYIGSYTPDSPSSEPVPEPATLLLFGTGILALATKHRKARTK